jgi:parvulin-like peptidyl-prolyl isomerase
LSRRELAARLGDGFARRVFSLSEGRWWGPIESSYGVHWVRVRERVPARVPDVAEVRGALTRHWMADRDEEALALALAALRGE